MSSNIKVSVVVPIYNAEKYLSQCLNSLSDQTLKDIEIICVNDGSTDDSLSILEEYADKDDRIKIISQENMGVSIARNIGLNEANGKYLCFVDSDDWLELNALEMLFDYAEKLDLEITFYQFLQFNEVNNIFEENPFFKLSIINDITFDNISFNYKDISDVLFDLIHASYNKLFNLNFLRSFDAKFDEKIRIGEDADFHYKLIFNAERLGFLRKPLYIYRISENSATTSNDKSFFDIFDVIYNIEGYLMEKGIYEDFKQHFFKFSIINFKYCYIRLNENFRDEFVQLLKEAHDKLNFNQLNESVNEWHFDDRVFYQAIDLSSNGNEFELTYKKLYYEFLSNHYERLVNQLQVECNRLTDELDQQNNFKSKVKRSIKWHLK